MKPAPSAASRKQELLRQSRTTALLAHLDRTVGHLNPDSLSRSYGLELADVTKILQRRGRLQNGKLAVPC